MSQSVCVVSDTQRLVFHIGIVRGRIFVRDFIQRDEDAKKRALEKFIYESVDGPIRFVVWEEYEVLSEQGYESIVSVGDVNLPTDLSYADNLGRAPGFTDPAPAPDRP